MIIIKLKIINDTWEVKTDMPHMWQQVARYNMGSENSERSISKTQNAQNKAETYKGNFLQPSLHHLDCET